MDETILTPAQEPVQSFPLSCYDNRELSWLKFDARVLEEANDPLNPLCERLSFLSIFQSNMDEYFMVRVGTLFDQRKSKIRDNKSRMTCKEQLDAILPEVRRLFKERDRTYKSLMKQLRKYDTEIVHFENLSDKEKRNLERFFLGEVLPLLSPQIIGTQQPFPFLDSKGIYAVVQLKPKQKQKDAAAFLGIIPCSNPVLHRLVPVSHDGGRYVLMEDLILHFSPRIFEHFQVQSQALIRIVRNADISIDDSLSEMEGKKKDYRKAMERMIQRRKRLSPIKMEYTGLIDANVIDTLCRALDLSQKYVFASAAPLDLSFLYAVSGRLGDHRELFYQRRTPQPSPAIAENERVIDQIRKKDVLLAFPYESIRPFLRLLNEAASDPEVVSIKITLYRMAKNSQIADALIQAAENGKEVLVLMELRARFDEENNVEHSRDLENAGCRVIYGLERMKTHSKLCLITRKCGDGIETVTQIGTGNYNENTAKIYTDYSLITADREIGEDAASVFQHLALGEVVHEADTLLVAPECLQNRIVERIDRQIALAQEGKPAYVGFKINALTDKVIIDKLIEASRAGVKVDLLVRGICCLVAGIPGYTDNIQVTSIVGRYLEHGRIYIFGCGGEEEVYIASADMMTRNTIHRVEVGAPLKDPAIRARVLEIFRDCLRDNVKLRIQQEDGNYIHRERGDNAAFCAQEYFAEQSYAAAGTPLPEATKEVKPEDIKTETEEVKPEETKQEEAAPRDGKPEKAEPETAGEATEVSDTETAAAGSTESVKPEAIAGAGSAAEAAQPADAEETDKSEQITGAAPAAEPVQPAAGQNVEPMQPIEPLQSVKTVQPKETGEAKRSVFRRILRVIFRN